MKIACLILLLCFGPLVVSTAQTKKIFFKHLSVEDGLSSIKVNTMMQDSRGYFWIGTPSGLNKYDGYRFTIYKNEPEDSTTISNNSITDMLEDQEGNLWISTWNGLNHYNRNTDLFTTYTDTNQLVFGASNSIASLIMDGEGVIWMGTPGGLKSFNPQTKEFATYKNEPSNPHSLANNEVSSLLEDNGKLWVGTMGGGLDMFDMKSNKFTHHQHDPTVSTSIGNNKVQTLFMDSDGVFWIGTEKGLYVFDRSRNEFTRKTDESNIQHSDVTKIKEDSEGNIWIGTENNGIYVYNKFTQTFTNLKHNQERSSLSNNSIYSIYRDPNDNMWIGTFSGGINTYYPNSKKFKHYKKIAENDNSVSHNSILSFTEDGTGIWIATDGGGINHFNVEDQSFKRYLNEPLNDNSLSGNYVVSLTVDADLNLWAVTWGEGVTKLLKDRKTFVRYKNNPSDSTSLSSDYCFALYCDSKNDIWVGTMGAGLNLLNADSQLFTRYLPNPDVEGQLNSRLIYAIMEDHLGNMWIGTEDMGINVLNREKNKFTYYSQNLDKPYKLSDNTVKVIVQDDENNLWIGTNNGLNKFNPETKSFKVYFEKDGLPSSSIESIEIDHDGRLWLGTSYGLSRFEPKSELFRNYTVDDGLQGNEFFRRSSFLSKDGEMYFGGNNGFNVFHPDSIKDNTSFFPIVLTDLLIFNKPAKVGGDNSPLERHISETDTITLSYDQSVFTIEFATLDFIYPQKIQYAYKLENFDKDWNYIGSRRTATYTRLAPGEYVFSVKSTNNDGYWNPSVKTLRIIVTPPFWLTVWFRALVLVIIVGSIMGFFRLRVSAIKKQKRLLEKKVYNKTREVVAQKEAIQKQQNEINAINQSLRKLVNEQKDLIAEKEFLIREVHHRVKNNLQILMSLLNSQSGYTSNTDALQIIQNSQHKLHSISLIHQKLYSDSDLTHINMNSYITDLIYYFKDSFDTQNISFVLDIDEILMDVNVSVPIGLILNEAITNSIKYAYEYKTKGNIYIRMKHYDNQRIKLCVKDEGKGFPVDIDVDNSSSLGMSLIKGLTQQLDGTIVIESADGVRIDIEFPYEYKTSTLLSYEKTNINC
jgi:ligand-binding sensor domain-containing protein/two-component sensor histidine kinase